MEGMESERGWKGKLPLWQETYMEGTGTQVGVKAAYHKAHRRCNPITAEVKMLHRYKLLR